MVAIARIQDVANKWQTNAGRSVEYYRDGVANPTEDWETEARGAEDNWAESVRRAADEGLFGMGVRGKGGKWQRNATNKGPNRYREGVQAAGDDFRDGFGPYRDAIEGFAFTTPRGPRGATGNYDRVREIGEMLHQMRIGG